MTRISLVSTIQVADVPRHLNAALNWAFDESHWTNVFHDVPTRELRPTILSAWDRLRRHNVEQSEACLVLSRMIDAIDDNPNGQLVVE